MRSLLQFWLAAAVVLSLAVAVAASSASTRAADEPYVLWVIPERCLARFLAGDLLHLGCLKQTASRGIGVAIIAGAFIVKLPQIVAFVSAGSAAGMSLSAAYAELVGYALTIVFHVVNGSPFTAYGEAIIVAAQSAAVVAIMWAYKWPGAAHAAGVGLVLAIVAQASMTAATTATADGSRPYLALVQAAATLLFMGARLAQIADNARAGSTGTLALLTLVMNFGGSAARIFTAAVEVWDRPEVLLSFVISTALNGALLVQYAWYYGRPAAQPTKAASAPAALHAAAAGEEAPVRRGNKRKAA